MSKGQLNEVEQMKRCLAVLQKDGMSVTECEGEEEQVDEEDEDERESALEILSELCENLDNARGELKNKERLLTCLSLQMVENRDQTGFFKE